MTGNVLLPVCAAIAIGSIVLAQPTMAQEQPIKSTFVHLGPGVPGVLYEPLTPAAKSQIGIFVMHSSVDYLEHSACTELSKRGYRVLCANNTTSKAGTSDDGSIDRMLLDAKLGVAWLRKQTRIRKVVLLGHSGGGAMMSAYQYVAENGLKACQGPEKIIRCSDNLANLPPADGLMLIDSNWGIGAMTLFSIDPAVVSEADGLALSQELDLFNLRNGFNPAGSAFSDEFVRRFLSAEGKRNNQLIQTALNRLAEINAGKGRYRDDEPFIVPGANFKGGNNKLFSEDVRLMSHTRKAWPLLHPDGSIVTQVVRSVRVPENPDSLTSSLEKGALKTTVRNFLSTYALRVTNDYGYDEDSVRGIDWSSSYSCPPGNVEGVTVPLLTMGMTGHWEYLAAETIFEHAKSADKALAFVDGATHFYTTCKECEKYPGQFGDTQRTTYDYVDSWLSKKGRF
jgi:hypothetical protein